MSERNRKHYKIRVLLDEEKKKEILTELSSEHLGYTPAFDAPKTYNEKIMWMKLYYQNPLLTTCADKHAVKEYVSSVIGSEHIVPTIATWTDPDEIDFDALPERFVLKVNWSTGYNIIVQDKNALDPQATRKQLKEWIQPQQNSYYDCFNWAYRHMKPVVYAETYLESPIGQLLDYKFFICNGKYEFMLIAANRENPDLLTFDFYDRDFRHLPFRQGRPNSSVPLKKPLHFQEMIAYAEALAKPFPFVRVDFYEVGDRVYVGEMTFYPGDALLDFTPQKWDTILGDKITLPEKVITDNDPKGFRFQKSIRKASLATGEALKKAMQTAVCKGAWEGNRYLAVLGLRIPYMTHVETGTDQVRSYIRMLGLEFCYRKRPPDPEPVNYGLTWTWQDNTDKEAFLMEEKISPDMQIVHCEQKAYQYLGYFPDLKNPQTLNEKIIWLALNMRDPVVPKIANKATAREWIISKIGEEYVVPLIGIYERVGDIDFSLLPMRFVAKLNGGWNSEKTLIVRDKSCLNIDQAKAVISSWLYPWNNYHYHNLCCTDDKFDRPLIVIEEYIGTDDRHRIQDYKFFCCGGEPRFAYVAKDPDSENRERTLTFVDLDWNILPAARTHASPAKKLTPPSKKEEMIRLCRTLSKDFPFVRVDFYEVNGRVYVGELTFVPSMFGKIIPVVWDRILGEYLDLTAYADMQEPENTPG